MFKQFLPYFTQSRKGHAALTAVACLVALTAAPTAGATSRVDAQFFTITAMKSGSGTPARVLTATDSGSVELRRRTARSAAQEWIAAQDPSGPALTGLSACLERITCPFTNPEPSTPRKFVNRATAECLSIAPAPPVVRVAPCHAQTGGDDLQRFAWNFPDAEITTDGVPQRYTALAAESDGHLRCLTASSPAGQAVKAAGCTNRLRWEQQYRFTAAA